MKLPWQQPCPAGRLTPARVRRGFRNIRENLPELTSAPKPGRPGPGRPRARIKEPPPGHPARRRQDRQTRQTQSKKPTGTKVKQQAQASGHWGHDGQPARAVHDEMSGVRSGACRDCSGLCPVRGSARRPSPARGSGPDGRADADQVLGVRGGACRDCSGLCPVRGSGRPSPARGSETPAAGGPGSAIAPLAAGAPDGPRGQRTARYSRRKSLVVTGVGVVLLAAPITVIEVMNSSTPSTNQLTADQLRPGDCLAGSNMDLSRSNPWPEYVTRVPCTKRHEAEIFFAGNIWPQSLAFPGKDAIGSQSDARCGEAFAAYDGIDASQSAFSYADIIPDSSDWASGDRSLACVAWEPSSSGPSGGAPVNYSIKGSKK